MKAAEKNTDVLVIGGGPVGMLIAAELAQQGVKVVLGENRTHVDKRPRAGTIHARSLSHLARRGYIPSTHPNTIPLLARQLHHTEFQFAGNPGLTLTAPGVEPGALAGIPQAILEEKFEYRAQQLGALIHRGTTARQITVHADRVEAELESSSQLLRVTAQYCVGADGARSLVAATGSFPSVETPATMNAIAGLAVSSHNDPPPGWNSTPQGWTMHNPNPIGKGRVIGMDFRAPDLTRDTPTEAEYLATLTSVLGKTPQLSEISHLTRFSDYGRYRSTMRKGRLLLIGDAAHIHYPLGGQGLNTGMQDAFTLGWRLADVLFKHQSDTILDAWSQRRVKVAAVVIGNTVLQSRMMNPAMTDLRDAVMSMLTIPSVHDGFADMISGQFQPGFVKDLALQDTHSGAVSSLAQLLQSGKHVELRNDKHAPSLSEGYANRVITGIGSFSPAQPWRSALIAPDGYLVASCA